MKADRGFREREHTADWELEAWAPDFPSLLEQAALGLYALSGVRLHPGERRVRRFMVSAPDQETLLVRFLNELLYYGEQENLGFDQLKLNLSDMSLTVEAQGGVIAHRDKLVKAVTYHNLAVRRTEQGLEVNIVFDV